MTTNGQSQWPIKRIRFVTKPGHSVEQRQSAARATEATFLPMESIGQQGELDRSRVRAVDEVNTGYTQFFDGDVVVAKITPCFENGKGALVDGLIGGMGFGTTELHVLTPGPEVDGRFLYYVTASPSFRLLGEASMTGSAGQKRVSEDFIRDFQIFIPPLELQRAIARYLDRETARLDALVAAKERVLYLLAEKRGALITRAATRGIDFHPLRNSGIPWLGEIPANWTTRRLAWLFRERDERNEPDLALLAVSINEGVVLRKFSDERIEATAADFNIYKVARRGDVVFNKMRMWQGAVGIAPHDGLVSPDYVVAEPTGAMSSDYAGILFRTAVFSAECARHSHGIVWDRLRLYWEGFRDIVVPVPPLHEQSRLVNHIISETVKLDRLRVSIERSVRLIRERRASLIAAAVTGQFDLEAVK